MERFESLDALRGLAALAVVLWHWQHFFYQGTRPHMPDIQRLPLSPLLSLFYTQGWLGVDLFFALSGFILYWLYSERVAERRISAPTFWLLRFSRLYPLHFATLIAVAIGQWLYMRETGDFFVYQFNDTRHFVLQLFLASEWGLQRGYSFSGPVWSV